MPCCVGLCFAVLRRAVPCCAAVHPALPCRAVLCRAVVCLAVAWQAAPCCAAARCVVLCYAVSWGALSRCAARRCAVLQCAVLRRVVPWCLVGPPYLRSGMGWFRRWLHWWLCCVGRGPRLCGWLVAGKRGLQWCGSLGLCCGGLGVLSSQVGHAGARGIALSCGLCLGPVSSGGHCP